MNDNYQRQLHFIFNDLANQYAERQSWNSEEEIIEDNPLSAFYFIERLLENAKTDLASFSNRQIGLGLDFIFSNNHSNLANDFKQANVPFLRKEKALRTLVNLFRDVLNARCERQTSAGKQETVSTLNNFCYMFWDVCPWSTWFDYAKVNREGYDELLAMALDTFSNNSDSDDPALVQAKAWFEKNRSKKTTKKKTMEAVTANYLNQYTKLDTETRGYYEAIARVMEECLYLDNPACVESGLHGLGHMVPFLPDIAVPIIDRYLKKKKNPEEQLMRYAQAARTGMIL